MSGDKPYCLMQLKLNEKIFVIIQALIMESRPKTNFSQLLERKDGFVLIFGFVCI